MAKNTQKTRLFYSVDGVDFTMVEKLVQAAFPNQANPELDATDFESDVMEYIAGLRDSGNIPFGVNFEGNNTTHQELIAHQASGVELTFQISILDNQKPVAGRSVGTFVGFIQEFAGDYSPNTVQVWNGSVKVSGAVTVAHGQPAN